jgi:hypothetical protein
MSMEQAVYARGAILRTADAHAHWLGVARTDLSAEEIARSQGYIARLREVVAVFDRALP